MNDLTSVCKYTMPIFFADDSNLIQNSESLNEIEYVSNKELHEIVQWLKIN